MAVRRASGAYAPPTFATKEAAHEHLCRHDRIDILKLASITRIGPTAIPSLIAVTYESYLNFDTRSACSRITLALSVAAVPVGSPLYIILGFDQ